jgi:hypothetical protein
MDIAQIRQQLVSDPEVRNIVAHRAFEIYVNRHGGPGNAAEDWLRAESEILPRLVEEVVAKNHVAIESHDEAVATVGGAVERRPVEVADAAAPKKPARKAPVRKAAAKPAPKEAAAPAKGAARPSVAEIPAAKKASSRKSAAKPAPADVPEQAPAKKPSRKAPPKKA